MKFSIRDILWLTVVVALAAGWTIDRVTLHKAAAKAQAQAEAELVLMRAQMILMKNQLLQPVMVPSDL